MAAIAPTAAIPYSGWLSKTGCSVHFDYPIESELGAGGGEDRVAVLTGVVKTASVAHIGPALTSSSTRLARPRSRVLETAGSPGFPMPPRGAPVPGSCLAM